MASSSFPSGFSYAHSGRRGRQAHNHHANNLLGYAIRYIDKYSFSISGFGESNGSCGMLVGKQLDKEGRAIKFGHKICRRAECPVCWTYWARERVFDIAMVIEAYAIAYNQRPYACVMSVPPNQVKQWTWNDINTRLFRRGYRRASYVGVDGGYTLFHPFRLKRSIKRRLAKLGYGSKKRVSAGHWKGVREDALNLGSLYPYVDLSSHLHGIVFGSPQAHKGQDFVISFEDVNNKPIELNRSSVIGYLFYLLSHAGVSTDDFRNAYNLKSLKTTRAFGCLFRLDPTEILDWSTYKDLAKDIAHRLGMEWDEVNGLHPKSTDVDDGYDWIPIWDLLDLAKDKDWVDNLSDDQKEFWVGSSRTRTRSSWINGRLVNWSIDDCVLWWLKRGILPPYDFLRDWIPDDVEAVFEIDPPPPP